MLRGTWVANLPESISQLSQLTHIDLKSSYLVNFSTLPESILDLPNLRYLWIKRRFWVELTEEDEDSKLYQQLITTGCKIYN